MYQIGGLMPLTDLKLKKITQGSGDYTGPSEIADSYGLSVRISSKRKIIFQYRYRIKDVASGKLKPKRLKLGDYPLMTLKAARLELLKAKEQLERGVDPAIHKRLEKAQNQSASTISDCIDHFIERYVKLKRKNPDEIIALFSNHVTPHIGSLPAKDITLAHWLPIFDALVDKGFPVQAGNVLVKSKQMLKFCKQRGLIEINVLSDVNINDVGKKSEYGDRVLSDEELGKFWRILHSMPSKAKMDVRMVIAMKLLTIFGCRSSELRLSTHDEWDLDNKIWTVSKEKTKHGSEVVRPIPDAAIPLVEKLIQLSRTSYLFPPIKSNSRHPVVSRQSFTRLTDYINVYLEIPPFNTHDLRRTFTTKLSELNIEPYIVEQMLGHKLGGVFEVYNKHSFIEQKRVALNMWIERLAQISLVNISDIASSSVS